MLVNYGSDSDDSGDDQGSEMPSSSKVTQVEDQAASKTVYSLSTTAPKPRRRDGPLKITLEAPKRYVEDEGALDARPAKKARLEGAGSSSLLGILPPPKHKTPIAPRKKEENEIKPIVASKGTLEVVLEGDPYEDLATASSLTLLPPSRIAKGKEKALASAEPLVDFFSLETTITKVPSLSQTANQEILPPVKSAAPVVKEFVPPVPTPDDEYPGYYQLPSKQWAAYDLSYYQSVAKSWQQTSVEEEMHRRAGPAERVRKQWQGDEEDLQQISAMDEASRAQAEIENSKQLTAELLRSGPTAPNMKMTAARSSMRAKSRHQLSTLLTDAYSRRAEIEDKIAMSKRNRKESGNKYGF